MQKEILNIINNLPHSFAVIYLLCTSIFIIALFSYVFNASFKDLTQIRNFKITSANFTYTVPAMTARTATQLFHDRLEYMAVRIVRS